MKIVPKLPRNFHKQKLCAFENKLPRKGPFKKKRLERENKSIELVAVPRHPIFRKRKAL